MKSNYSNSLIRISEYDNKVDTKQLFIPHTCTCTDLVCFWLNPFSASQSDIKTATNEPGSYQDAWWSHDRCSRGPWGFIVERYWIFSLRIRYRERQGQKEKSRTVYNQLLLTAHTLCTSCSLFPYPYLMSMCDRTAFLSLQTLKTPPERPSSVKGYLIAVKIGLSGSPDLNSLTT